MSDIDELPEYTVLDSGPTLVQDLPLPDDDKTFTIGGRSILRPLVSVEQLRSHLRLLAMFASMKQKVDDPDSDPRVAERIPPLAMALPPEKRWIWFLELAVDRCVSVMNDVLMGHILR